MTSSFLSRCSLILAFCVAGYAQAAPSPTAATRGLQFRTLGWQVNTADLCYDLAGADTPVEIPAETRSKFYSHPAASTIAFYRVVTDEKGRKQRQPVVTADISNAGQWPLLVFVPDAATGPGHIRVIALKDDLASFPAPRYSFINLTPVRLGISFGSENRPLSARSVETFDPGAIDPDGSKTCFTTIKALGNQGVVTLYSNNWAVRPALRTLVVIFAQDDTLQVRRIVDNVSNYSSQKAGS